MIIYGEAKQPSWGDDVRGGGGGAGCELNSNVEILIKIDYEPKLINSSISNFSAKFYIG